MKQRCFCLGALVAFLTGLVGCGQIPTPITHAPSATSVAGALVTITPVANETAPSFEEIKHNIELITKTPEHPDGAPVGLDGITDTAVVQALKAYNQSVSGKQAKGWVGWYRGYTEVDPNNDYTVAILMRQPAPDVRYFTDVLLTGLTTEGIEPVQSLKYGQQVILTGTIGTIDWSGQVELVNATIASVK